MHLSVHNTCQAVLPCSPYWVAPALQSDPRHHTHNGRTHYTCTFIAAARTRHALYLFIYFYVHKKMNIYKIVLDIIIEMWKRNVSMLGKNMRYVIRISSRALILFLIHKRYESRALQLLRCLRRSKSENAWKCVRKKKYFHLSSHHIHHLSQH